MIGGVAGLSERDWEGGSLRIGEVVIGVENLGLMDFQVEPYILTAVQARAVHIFANIVEKVPGDCHGSGLHFRRAPYFQFDMSNLLADRLTRIGNSDQVIFDRPRSRGIDPEDKVSHFVVPVSLLLQVGTKQEMETYR